MTKRMLVEHLSKAVRSRLYLVAVVGCLGLFIPHFVSAADAMSISLLRESVPDTASYPSWATVEFAAADTSYFRFPANTTDWETGNLPTHASALPIVLGRCKNARGEWQLFYDERLDQDFAKGTILVPDSSGGLPIFLIKVAARPGGAPDSPTDDFQIKISGSVVLARRADFRAGHVQTKAGDIPIRLYRTLDVPSYGISKSTILLADTTRDGEFTPNWNIAPDGTLKSSERFELNWPLAFDGQRLMARKLDPEGTTFELSPFASDTFAAVGYYSQNWTLVDLNNIGHSCASFHGKIVVTLLWSTTCHFCEQVRPAWNEFAARCDTSKVQCIAVADVGENQNMVYQFTRSHPFGGLVVTHDRAIQMLNHGTGTPAYCVIDGDGVVQMIGNGASFFPLMEAKVKQMLEK